MARAWAARARVRLGLGLAAPALEDARRAARLDPGHADHLLLEGAASRLLGEPDEALAACRAALALDDSLAPAWLVVVSIKGGTSSTSTENATSPISSVTFAVEVALRASRTLRSFEVLNPSRETATSYSPAGRLLKRYWPTSLLIFL
jgi:tetratricopeptide (TPR) repeat protein